MLYSYRKLTLFVFSISDATDGRGRRRIRASSQCWQHLIQDRSVWKKRWHGEIKLCCLVSPWFQKLMKVQPLMYMYSTLFPLQYCHIDDWEIRVCPWVPALSAEIERYVHLDREVQNRIGEQFKKSMLSIIFIYNLISNEMKITCSSMGECVKYQRTICARNRALPNLKFGAVEF